MYQCDVTNCQKMRYVKQDDVLPNLSVNFICKFYFSIIFKTRKTNARTFMMTPLVTNGKKMVIVW